LISPNEKPAKDGDSKLKPYPGFYGINSFQQLDTYL
jgi:hypothetical protein